MSPANQAESIFLTAQANVGILMLMVAMLSGLVVHLYNKWQGQKSAGLAQVVSTIKDEIVRVGDNLEKLIKRYEIHESRLDGVESKVDVINERCGLKNETGCKALARVKDSL